MINIDDALGNINLKCLNFFGPLPIGCEVHTDGSFVNGHYG